MAQRPEYRLVVTERPGRLHVAGNGQNVPENVQRFLREAYDRLFDEVEDAQRWLAQP